MRGALLALLLAPGFVQAQALPEALTAHLARVSLLRVDFRQTRTLAALSRPLRSSGSLVVSKGHGVIWQVAKPLALTVVVGPKGVLEVDPAGRRKLQSAKDVPMVAQMGRIMMQLLEGRWSALEELFTVQGEGTKEKWTVTLVPLPRTAAFIGRVQVTGARFIEGIHVTEASGDRTDLAFLRPRVDLPLAPDELRLFSLE